MALAPGTVVEIDSGEQVTIGRCLGEGGQGWVFEVHDRTGAAKALKWYKSAPAGQRENLAYLVERGAPSPRFLWPTGLAHVPGVGGFGYLMPLRPFEYQGLAGLLHGVDDRGAPLDVPWLTVVGVAYQLSKAFLQLHSLGLCYRDINYGNVFFHPRSGAVLVCDNDNVGVDGSPGGVMGVPGFMAPEVVLLLAGRDTPGAALPSARTDLHSLAVTLFLILHLSHPLEGAKTETGILDVNWQLEHFGYDPLFVFDSADARNRPTGDVVGRYWSAYPRFLHELFTTAFTEGLRDPDARVRESVWVAAMLRLRDLLASCPRCGGSSFHDPDVAGRPCLRCGVPLEALGHLEVGRHSITLLPRSRLWSDHLGGESDSAVIVGRVEAHPADPDRFGLQNHTQTTWTARMRSGETHEVAPGRSVELVDGARLDFRIAEGTVRRR